MALQSLDANAARDAWSELYCRHSRYVAKVASRALGEHARDADTVADLVNDAFHSVFDWAGRQSRDTDLAERFAAPDRDVVRSKVLSFLATVTRRLVAHTFTARGRAPREFLHDDIDQMPAGAGEDTEPPPSTERSKLDAVLELLSSDEAEALRVSLPWYQPETGEFAFPRGEAARVAATLGITPETLRQRRCRSLKRLQSLLGPR
jgi:DNA-directed RNA polymerase specialized sigma24 family protein